MAGNTREPNSSGLKLSILLWQTGVGDEFSSIALSGNRQTVGQKEKRKAIPSRRRSHIETDCFLAL